MYGAATTPTQPILAVAAEMANAHNLLLRGLNAIYLQAPHIRLPADIADFTLFALTWADALHHHHAAEETHFFPAADALARATLGESVMGANLAQHAQLEVGLEALRAWVEAVRRGAKVYDGAELRACVDVFAGVLMAHLRDEIDSILKLEGCDGDEVKRIFDKCSEEAAKGADPVSLLCSAVLCCAVLCYATLCCCGGSIPCAS
jgi:hemerythrin-like domain-containing protein